MSHIDTSPSNLCVTDFWAYNHLLIEKYAIITEKFVLKDNINKIVTTHLSLVETTISACDCLHNNFQLIYFFKNKLNIKPEKKIFKKYTLFWFQLRNGMVWNA